MTRTQQIVALAEWRGWQAYPLGRNTYDTDEARRNCRLIENVQHGWSLFPAFSLRSTPWDPWSSDADIRDLLNHLPANLSLEYGMHLLMLVDPSGEALRHQVAYRAAVAAPAERTEALLRSLGLEGE